MEKKLKQGTLCVQAGYKAKNGEPIELPIIQSTTFKYDDSDEMAKLFDLEKEGYFYTRLHVKAVPAHAADVGDVAHVKAGGILQPCDLLRHEGADARGVLLHKGVHLADVRIGPFQGLVAPIDVAFVQHARLLEAVLQL